MDWLLEYAKYIALLLGLLAGLPFIWRWRKRLGLKHWQIPLLGLFFTLGTLLCTIVLGVLEQLLRGEPLNFGATSVYGLYMFFPLLLLAASAICKLDRKRLFDTFAQFAPSSLFIMRCNCLRAGCCMGTQIPGTALRWPTREIEMVFYVGICVYLLLREKKNPPEGTAFPLLMCTYSALRFFLEWFRAVDSGAIFHLAHIWSILVFGIGLWTYRKLSQKNPGK